MSYISLTVLLGLTKLPDYLWPYKQIMEQNKNTEEGLFTKLVNKALAEAEELKVQLWLGKKEAAEIYDEMKKGVNHSLHEFSENLRKLREDERWRPAVNAAEHLRVQLALGLAESEDLFEAQKHKILKAVHELENKIRNSSGLEHYQAQLHLELEKMKLRLELISLRFRLGKVKAEYNFDEKKEEWLKAAENFRSRMKILESTAANRWDSFQKELSASFQHFRNVFK